MRNHQTKKSRRLSSVIALVGACWAFAFTSAAFANHQYFCQSESGRTTLNIWGDRFEIRQDYSILRHGHLAYRCAESWPARCTFTSDRGKIAYLIVGDTVEGTIYYTKRGEAYATPVTCVRY